MTISDEPRSTGAARLHAIAAGLTAVGLATHLHRTRAGTDLTATLHLPGYHDIEVIADEDGYIELRYWCSLSSTPAANVATIARLLEELTTSQSLASRTRRASGSVAGYDGAVTERAEGAGMTGPHDHLAEQGRIPDQARPRAADNPHDSQVRPDDLQGRLERLPPNHPSSPYRDDGSRKPPPPDLTKYELPLPDESGSPADPDLAEQPSIAPDGSWDWKGQHLTPTESRAGDQGLAHCREREGRDVDGNYADHGLTPAMRRIEAQLDNSHLAPNTEQFALKEPDRYKEKLAKLITRFPGESPEDLTKQIHDGIRYTFVSSSETYVSNFWDVSRRLQGRGFELMVRTNTWGNEEYKGVNTRWRDSEGDLIFEVQVHSYESLEAKEGTHKTYERINDVRTPVEEIEILRSYQKYVSAQVPQPQGWQDIPDYRKEDL